MPEIVAPAIKQSGRGIGRALAKLGLEDKFLKNGELTKLPFAVRGEIVREIVDTQLERGQWQSVVEMIHGGVGKADVLYDGDIDELNKRIAETAKRVGMRDIGYFSGDVFKALENKNPALLLDIAEKSGLGYERFQEMLSHVNLGESEQRYNKICADKAFSEGKYGPALYNFQKAKDDVGIEKVFDAVLSSELGQFIRESGSILQNLVANSTDKKSAVKRIVKAGLSKKSAIDITVVYSLALANDIEMPEEDRRKLREGSVESIHQGNLHAEPYKRDSALPLLWAKRNAVSEPNHSYQIFKKEGYKGEERGKAVLAGITMEWSKRQYGHSFLNIEEVEPEDLRTIIGKTEMYTQVSIARHLKDSALLVGLSKKFEEEGNESKAYELLWDAYENPPREDLDRTIKKAVERQLSENVPSFYFIDNRDIEGLGETYTTLMNAGKSNPRLYRDAFNIAEKLKDDARVQEVRNSMIERDAVWALKFFVNVGNERKDETGYELALTKLAEESGADRDELARIIGKYGI